MEEKAVNDIIPVKNNDSNDLISVISSIFNKIIDGIGSFMHERQDIINKLEDHGIEITEDRIQLLKCRRKYNTNDQFIVKQLIEEMISNRQKKFDIYNNEITKAIENINSAKIRANKEALIEFRSDQKTIKKALREQYGLLGSIKYIRQRNSSKDFEKEIKEKINYYISVSNIQLLEETCREIRLQYKLETSAFIDVIAFLKKSRRNEEDKQFILTYQNNIESFLNKNLY